MTAAEPEPDGGLIAVVGGESTGKSTLAAALAFELPGVLVPETLRSWVAERGRVPRADEQREVMKVHAGAEEQAMAPLPQSPSPAPTLEPVPTRTPPRQRLRWVVSDGGTLMTAVYSLLYYDDASLLLEAVELSRRARLVVWCGSDIPWTADEGQRDGPHMRARAQEILGEVLASSNLPWVLVQGSTAKRLQQVGERLRASE